MEGGHLWVVISDPEGYPQDDVVIVNLTTDQAWKDRSCVLHPGEHPYIKHQTLVYYRETARVPPERMAVLESGHLRMDAKIAPRVLARIRMGAAASIFTPTGCVDVLRTQGLVR